MTTQSKAVEAMLAHVTSECTSVDTDRLYDDMLDECYSFESVGGCFACMSPSRVLKECDPIAYSEYNPDHVDHAAEEFIDGLRSELTDLETERDELDEDEIGEYRRLTSAINDKEAAINECEKHQW